MIGPDFLSTFRLKPIETIGEWEDARLWKLNLEAELYRRERVAEEDGFLQRNVGAVQDSAEVVPADVDSDASVVVAADSVIQDSAEVVPAEVVPADMDSDASVLVAADSVIQDSAVQDSTVKMPDRLTFEFTLSEVVSLLGVLTDHFDRYFWYNESTDVIDEIRSRMQKQEFRNCDLVEEIGSKGYVSDILNRRKPLTLRTARIFKEFFDIPAEWLFCGYKLDPREVDNVKFGSRFNVGKVPNKKSISTAGAVVPKQKQSVNLQPTLDHAVKSQPTLDHAVKSQPTLDHAVNLQHKLDQSMLGQPMIDETAPNETAPNETKPDETKSHELLLDLLLSKRPMLYQSLRSQSVAKKKTMKKPESKKLPHHRFFRK